LSFESFVIVVVLIARCLLRCGSDLR